MAITSGMNLLGGYSTGYLYTQNKFLEDEARQGKNYYMSALSQRGQLILAGGIVSKLSGIALRETANKVVAICCSIFSLISIPICLSFAIVKQGHYETASTTINSIIPYFQLPQELGNRTIEVMSFLAEHTGDMTRVAVVVGSVALIALGHSIFGGAVLIALGYEAIDRRGFLPRKVSLFVETYMPTVSLFGLLAVGNLPNRVFSAIVLPSHFFPSFSNFIHVKTDWVFSQKVFPYLARKRPGFISEHELEFFKEVSLEEINSPLKNRKNLSFEGIQNILNSPSASFKVDPAHMSKFATDQIAPKTDDDFDKLLHNFSTVNWKNKYTLIVGKLRHDERFIHYVSDECKENDLKKISKDFDHYVGLLAQKAHIDKHVFLANYLKGEFEILVEILKGKKRVTGSQQDLETAIHNCAKIIPYLEKLLEENDTIQYEDVLLKLGVEGGNYCARGIKRASNEICSSYRASSKEVDPDANYETKLRQGTERLRLRIVEQMFQRFREQIFSKLPDSLVYDVHSFDIYRLFLSLGFIPLTDYEKRSIDLSAVILWEVGFKRILCYTIRTYEQRMLETFKELGEIHFYPFLTKLVNENSELSPEQRKEIIDGYSYPYDNNGYYIDNHADKFYRLVLVMLGILKCD